MTVLTKLDYDEEGDAGELQCGECDAVFTIYWNRQVDITGIEFCPFCGDEVEAVEE